MQKSERDALREQVLSEDWKCSADLLLRLLDALDEMEQQIARQNMYPSPTILALIDALEQALVRAEHLDWAHSRMAAERDSARALLRDIAADWAAPLPPSIRARIAAEFALGLKAQLEKIPHDKQCPYCLRSSLAPSQSDEERATDLIKEIRDWSNYYGEDQARIARALAAVREEERMACYQLALDLAETGDGYDIAAAIRARKTTQRPADGER